MPTIPHRPFKTAKPYADLFPPCKQVDLSRLQVTPISLYSITPWKEADLITHMILKHFQEKGLSPADLVITDATANVGGNTISFLRHGLRQLTAYEIDPTTAQMLHNNLAVYGYSQTNIKCQDYVTVYRQTSQHVVFLDPPWGGPSYHLAKCLDLYLSGHNIIDICRDLFNHTNTQLVVLKLPINYNLPGLIHGLPTQTILTRKIFRNSRHVYNVVLCYGRSIDF
jgi:hypothetical protein